MLRSTGFRYFIVGLLVILMFVPLFFVSVVVDGRADYSRDTARDLGNEWGGEQTFGGPFIVVPVSGPVLKTRKAERLDDSGKRVIDTIEYTELGQKTPAFFLPNLFSQRIATELQTRKRGIFEVPVYNATSDIAFDFDLSQANALLGEGETFDWNNATLRISVTRNKALRGAAKLTIDGRDYPLEPRTGVGGLEALVGDVRQAGDMTLALAFNGAGRVMTTPVGRVNEVKFTSNWPHPSFTGEFLPDSREINDAGFTANWSIPHFARSVPQQARSDIEAQARKTASFGVRFFQPNDFYQKAYRAGRYAILLIALTFLTLLLMERKDRAPVHPVQYILVGLAQSVFVLLMVAYAEQIGFTPAYIAASAATIVLLVMFAFAALKMGKRTWVVAALLILLYAVLYLILRSADFALLAGATLAFVALAGTMFFTRNEDWYGAIDLSKMKKSDKDAGAVPQDAE